MNSASSKFFVCGLDISHFAKKKVKPPIIRKITNTHSHLGKTLHRHDCTLTARKRRRTRTSGLPPKKKHKPSLGELHQSAYTWIPIKPICEALNELLDMKHPERRGTEWSHPLHLDRRDPAARTLSWVLGDEATQLLHLSHLFLAAGKDISPHTANEQPAVPKREYVISASQA